MINVNLYLPNPVTNEIMIIEDDCLRDNISYDILTAELKIKYPKMSERQHPAVGRIATFENNTTYSEYMNSEEFKKSRE